jgi:hypothetical protein
MFRPELMRRMLFDSVALIGLIVGGIALYVASSSAETPVNFVSQFQNVIWIFVAVLFAIIWARTEILLQGPKSWWVGLLEWTVIIVAANLALFWLDVVVHPQDNFKTMFAFGFLIFLVPSTVFSVIAYSIFRLTGRSGQ